MKITKSQMRAAIKEAYQDGVFSEVTEDILSDDIQLDELLVAFLSEIRMKKVVRGKKLVKKAVCPKNKRYVPALKKCVTKTAGEKVKKHRSMKKAALKKRGKMARINRKRKKSMKKRKSFGLKR
ncbi:MAG: hypothetical protein H8E03_01530 [Pelagibacteraceae bacterium]|nr:hypothetical protein [Pelagibacteraceae bacterium]